MKGELKIAPVQTSIAVSKKDQEMMIDLEFELRDYIKDVRAKSAHPLGRSQTARSMSILGNRMERSIELSALNHSASLPESKFDRQQAVKERKDKMKSFTDKRLNRIARRKNRDFVDRIHEEINKDRTDADRKNLKELLEQREENRLNKLRRQADQKRHGLVEDIKQLRERNKKAYYDRFPNVPNEVRELREMEHRDKYLKELPLHQRLLKDFEEREKRKLKEVKDELQQVRNQPIDFAKLKQHEEKVMRLVQRQNEERKQIQSKMQEINSTSQVEKIKTIYQNNIGEVKDRMKKRIEYAEQFKAPNLKDTLGGEDDEGDEENEDGAAKSSNPPVDMRKKFSEKEDEEFQEFYDLKRDDDWSSFQHKSRFWDAAKLKRFHVKRLQYQTREFEGGELTKVRETYRAKPKKPRPQTEWDGDIRMYPKPVDVGKDGRPVFNQEEVTRYKEEAEKAKKLQQERMAARNKQTLSPAEQKAKEIDRKKKYDEMIKEMRNKYHLKELTDSPERRLLKMSNYKKLNELGKMEDRVKSMEQLNTVINRSLKNASSAKLPPLADFNKRRSVYLKMLLTDQERAKATQDKNAYPSEKLQAMYKEKREKEAQEMLAESIKKESEIDDLYMTAINTKLDMLEKQQLSDK